MRPSELFQCAAIITAVISVMAGVFTLVYLDGVDERARRERTEERRHQEKLAALKCKVQELSSTDFHPPVQPRPQWRSM